MLLLATGELCDLYGHCILKVKVKNFHPKTCHEGMGGGVRCIGLTSFSRVGIATRTG